MFTLADKIGIITYKPETAIWDSKACRSQSVAETMPKTEMESEYRLHPSGCRRACGPSPRCAMTTVVAPMGYGKTTAVNWYLSERAKAETLRIIRISVYPATRHLLVRGGVARRV